jgi:hypothetical protein
MSTGNAPEAPKPTPPLPAKTVWTNADFDELTWHDNTIHALAVEPLPDNPGRLLLDVDYIVEWVASEPPETTLNCWICPATLVFGPAWDLVSDIDMEGWGFHLDINEIERSEPDNYGNFEWTLNGDLYTIRLGSPGFTLYLRQSPIYSDGFRLSVAQRGGYSFAEQGYTP